MYDYTRACFFAICIHSQTLPSLSLERELIHLRGYIETANTRQKSVKSPSLVFLGSPWYEWCIGRYLRMGPLIAVIGLVPFS